jgi:hypothetical protein
VRITTTVYAHRAVRNLLVFEVAADFGPTTDKSSSGAAAAATVTVGLDRCGGGTIDWSNLSDFNATSASLNADGVEVGEARTLVVKYMEENCDSSHYCPQAVPLIKCNGLGRCTNSAMPQHPHTEVGLAFEPLPPTLTLTQSQPTQKFIAAIHTSLEPGLGRPGAAATAAAATLAQYAGVRCPFSLYQSSTHSNQPCNRSGGNTRSVCRRTEIGLSDQLLLEGCVISCCSRVA